MSDELGLSDASLFPHLSEPRDALLPVEEGFVMREVWVLLDDVEEGEVSFCDEVAEALSESFCELWLGLPIAD